MKYIVTLSLLLIALTSLAQKIKVTESDESIAGGKNPVLVVSIYEVNVEKVRSDWKSLMKAYKAKIVMGEEIKADNGVIKSINDNNSIDIYAKVEKITDNETKLTVAFDLGGTFLSSSFNKEKTHEAKKIVDGFAKKTTRDAIIELRKAEEKKLSNMQDEQKELEKKHEKLTSSKEEYAQKIEEYKQKIKEAEENTVKNKADQEKIKEDIVIQTKAVEAITAKEKTAD